MSSNTIYPSAIPGSHKPVYLNDQQIEKKDADLDWVFRKIKGPASVEATQVVLYMHDMAANPRDWEAFDFPTEKQEETLAACKEWLDGIGAPCAGHLEREY